MKTLIHENVLMIIKLMKYEICLTKDLLVLILINNLDVVQKHQNKC